jgi:hypothetical protein
MKKITQILIAFTLLIIALACGSGTSISGVDISGTGSGSVASETTVSGTITQFGSIYVGGVQFNTDNAKVLIDEELSTNTGLRLGMWVSVTTNNDTTSITAVANRVTYASHLAGELSLLDTSANTFTVKGTSITINADTHYGSIGSFSALSNNMDVIVSGEYKNSASLVASYIDVNTRKLDLRRNRDFFYSDVNNGDTVMLSGKFKRLLDSTTLVVNEFTITTDSRTTLEKALADLKEDDYIVIHGTKTSENTINASRIDVPHDHDSNNESNTSGQIESLSTEGKTIKVSGVTYTINRHTRFFISDQKVTDKRIGFDTLKVDDSVEFEYITKDGQKIIFKLTLGETSALTDR